MPRWESRINMEYFIPFGRCFHLGLDNLGGLGVVVILLVLGCDRCSVFPVFFRIGIPLPAQSHGIDAHVGQRLPCCLDKRRDILTYQKILR